MLSTLFFSFFQLLYLLDTLKNAIQKQNIRLSFVHATYIAKVAQQILRPGVLFLRNLMFIFRHCYIDLIYLLTLKTICLFIEEHMYLVISKFLLGTQYVDLKRVPDFFRLFYSFDLEVMHCLFLYFYFL